MLGVLFRVFWTDAPRWLYVPIYIALGWAAVFFIPAFFDGATALGLGIGIAVFVLIVVGGALYTVGGVVYGFKRPNPWPRWFGFHEVFHTFTILAFVTHYVGVSMATYALADARLTLRRAGAGRGERRHPRIGQPRTGPVRPSREMSETNKTPLTYPTVVAGAVAAATATALSTRLGLVGTILGAVVASMVSTLVSTVFVRWLRADARSGPGTGTRAPWQRLAIGLTALTLVGVAFSTGVRLLTSDLPHDAFSARLLAQLGLG